MKSRVMREASNGTFHLENTFLGKIAAIPTLIPSVTIVTRLLVTRHAQNLC